MPPRYSSGVRMVARIHGSSIASIFITSGMSAGLCSSLDLAVGQQDAVDDRGRGRDQVEVELALQPLLDDLQVQQAEEAAAEAEAERGGGLHLVGEAGVVEAQLAHRGAQVLELGRVDREQAAEHHRLRRLEAGQRRRGAARASSVMVSPTRVSATSLIAAVMKPTSPGPSSSTSVHLGAEHADAVDLVIGAGAHHADLVWPFLQHAVDDAHQHDDAEIGVVPAVDQQRLQRRGRVALRAAAGG